MRTVFPWRTRAGLTVQQKEELEMAVAVIAKHEQAILTRLEESNGFSREPAFIEVLRAVASLTKDEVLR